MVMSPTRPILLRSSGMLARPLSMNALGEKTAILLPSGPMTWPFSGLMRPVTRAASSDWPLPSMPATPRISPLWMVSETSFRPPCLTSGRYETSLSSKATSLAPLTLAYVFSTNFWPIMRSASACSVVSDTFTVSTDSPRRRTVT